MAAGTASSLRSRPRRGNIGDKVEIRIRDNGTGIPEEVKAKMFNPFFTTKPAGEGTGLGLSLSYDIIVKQHGGTIEVDTKPGDFTEFTIVLPRGGETPAISRECSSMIFGISWSSTTSRTWTDLSGNNFGANCARAASPWCFAHSAFEALGAHLRLWKRHL